MESMGIVVGLLEEVMSHLSNEVHMVGWCSGIPSPLFRHYGSKQASPPHTWQALSPVLQMNASPLRSEDIRQGKQQQAQEPTTS